MTQTLMNGKEHWLLTGGNGARVIDCSSGAGRRRIGRGLGMVCQFGYRDRFLAFGIISLSQPILTKKIRFKGS